MGTLGATGIKEKLLGSKTASVIGSTDIPLITIPYDYQWKKPEKILLATNRFEEEPNIFNPVFELAYLYMAQVSVAVFTDTDDDNAAVYLEHTRQMPRFEKKIKEQYREDMLTVSHLYGTEFEDTLQKYIAEQSIDMLVMITYQKKETVLNRILNPSKTRRMSFYTNIPLLAVTPTYGNEKHHQTT
jgi:nucleotide-binding universal stress UspA family protein